MLRESTLNYLQTRKANAGETVQLGWFWFTIVEGDGGLDVETLDFKKMASFTTDFQVPDRIYWAQQETLWRLKVDEQECTMMQSALVSRSYKPSDEGSFIERFEANDEHDSGWYVGMQEDSLDMNDEGSFERKSLYELTIHDQRFARFWLLPVGYRVLFDEAEPSIIVAEQAAASDC